MHPALSVIFFTVSSGAGFGLFILLALMDVFGIGGAMSLNQVLTAGITALVLISAGLLSSTGHLANKKNAWRAFFRWRTSWLAREAVFAVAFYPFAVLYLGLLWLNGGEHTTLIDAIALGAAALALITVFSTGMIYACLKTIRQWNTSLTPTNYITLGLMLGALVMVVVREGNETTATLALVLVAAAALLKSVYFFWIGRVKGSTLNTATGFHRGKVRLLDVGHTAGTFLTNEFGYEISCTASNLLRTLVFVLAFGVPTLFLTTYPMAAVLWAFAGVGVERWLFFAEARHVVMLYHGRQTT